MQNAGSGHDGRVAPRLSSRKGFTIVELLIALVLLDVGLLALVGLAASIARDAATSRIRTDALSAASARLERMASVACHGAASGVAQASPALTEWFSESPSPNETRTIVDSVAFMTARGMRTLVLQTAARC